MTEAEWLACEEPAEMLAQLRPSASNRKLRLFAAACCRRIWRMLVDERSQHAVELAEMLADGERQSARRAAYRERIAAAQYFAPDEAAAASIHRLAYLAAAEASDRCSLAWGVAADSEWAGADHVEAGARERICERVRQAALIRCIFGDRPQPVVWVTTLNSFASSSLASAAYAERELPNGHLDPARLGVLSYAL